MIVIAIILIFPLLFTSSSCLSPPVQEPTGNIADTYPKSLLNDILPSFSDYYENECSSVIVTGTASKDGRAILMKNRDWANDEKNRLVYIPATSSTFAYIGVNINAMGINERGLAVMNTAMPALESEPGIGNLFLNQKILELYESVTDVALRSAALKLMFSMLSMDTIHVPITPVFSLDLQVDLMEGISTC